MQPDRFLRSGCFWFCGWGGLLLEFKEETGRAKRTKQRAKREQAFSQRATPQGGKGVRGVRGRSQIGLNRVLQDLMG